MSYYPYFNLEQGFQDPSEIHRLAEEEEEDLYEEMVEEEEEMEEEEIAEEEEEMEEREIVEEREIAEEEEEEYEEESEEEEEWDVVDGDTMSFTLSATLSITLPTSCPSSPSTLSSYPLIWGIPRALEESVAWLLSISQSLQSPYTSTSVSNSDEEYSSQDEESSSTPKKINDGSSWRKLQNRKVTELVNLLILKYRMREPIKREEMLGFVTEDFEEQFPFIFEEASKCLEMIFGIDIKEHDPVNGSYILSNSLNLTYVDMSTERKPRNGFLIIILGVIFTEGNSASEESMWQFLNMIGVYDGKEHFIYGEPREFLTRDLVYENYLKYQQVPNSYPPRYEFLWGPRAYYETTRMEVLKYLAKITSRDPTYFSSLYSEASREEEERAA